MAFTLTNLGTGSGKAVTSFTITTTAAIPAGALLIIAGASNGSVNLITLSGISISGYTAASGTGVTSYLYYGINTGGSAVASGAVMTFSLAASSVNAATAFCVTGLNAANPFDNATVNTSSGSSTTPSVTGSGPPGQPNTLIIGVVGVAGPSGDTFTQDSTHAAYTTPPVRVGTTTASPNQTIDGGSVTSSAQLTYAPTLGTSRAWAALILGIVPAPTRQPSGVMVMA